MVLGIYRSQCFLSRKASELSILATHWGIFLPISPFLCLFHFVFPSELVRRLRQPSDGDASSPIVEKKQPKIFETTKDPLWYSDRSYYLPRASGWLVICWSYYWWQPEIRQTHQLRLVVYPIIYDGFHTSNGLFGISEPSTVVSLKSTKIWSQKINFQTVFLDFIGHTLVNVINLFLKPPQNETGWNPPTVWNRCQVGTPEPNLPLAAASHPFRLAGFLPPIWGKGKWSTFSTHLKNIRQIGSFPQGSGGK